MQRQDAAGAADFAAMDPESRRKIVHEVNRSKFAPHLTPDEYLAVLNGALADLSRAHVDSAPDARAAFCRANGRRAATGCADDGSDPRARFTSAAGSRRSTADASTDPRLAFMARQLQRSRELAP